jgi:hypothetical protein
MSKNTKSPASISRGAASQPLSEPELEGVTEVRFLIGGGIISPIIWGSNLNEMVLRVAVLNSAGNEIEYADDPNPSDANYEVYLYDPSANEVGADSFPLSLNVEKAVVGAYTLALTTAPRATKVVLGAGGVYGALVVEFTN